MYINFRADSEIILDIKQPLPHNPVVISKEFYFK